MKNLKLKIATFTVFTVILISVVLLSGCTKQDKKEATENKEKKTETTQQKNNMQHDSSMQMNHDNMDMSKDSKSDMNHDKMDMNKDSKSNKDESLTHGHIDIPTAQCDNCKKNLDKALKKVSGLKSFEVDIDQHMIHVYYDKKITDINKIENAITSAGYDANKKKANPDAYAKLDDCCKKPEDRKNKK
jgi:copper chaperone CopZ/outer membrane murein-binding lipoprotein Lpp